jgi:hypothetical protein
VTPNPAEDVTSWKTQPRIVRKLAETQFAVKALWELRKISIVSPEIKKRQQEDIRRAQALWIEYKRRKKEEN